MEDNNLLKHVYDKGLPEDFKVIHLFEAGSALHGARLEGNSDLDINGIFIEPAINALGMDPYEHFVTSTADNTRRNVAGDVDITLYSLRRWAWLLSKGNPNAINFLFAPNKADYWKDYCPYLMTKFREAALSKAAAGHYIGFVQGQMKRLLGQGTGKHGQRSELTEKYGYDTKAGMHAVRLIREGVELMETGRVSFPSPMKDELIEIRKGKYSLDTLCWHISQGIKSLETARDKSRLPEKPDRNRINYALMQAYLSEYNAGM